MSEAKFTKGEWRKCDERVGVVDSSDTQSYGMMTEVAFVDMYNFNKDECIANAHLIEVAPKMYHKLVEVEEYLDSIVGEHSYHRAMHEEITELLAEARGERND